MTERRRKSRTGGEVRRRQRKKGTGEKRKEQTEKQEERHTKKWAKDNMKGSVFRGSLPRHGPLPRSIHGMRSPR